MVQTTNRQLPQFVLAFVTTCCSLLIAACAGPGPALFSAQPCNGGVCKAVVTVQSCPGGTMSVNPDPIPVPAANNIEWTISTAGYIFANNGITSNDPDITGGHVTGSGKKFIVHNGHTHMGSIKYAVHLLTDPGGVACAPYDPYILNQ